MMRLLRYSPDQPRDDHGRFGEGVSEIVGGINRSDIQASFDQMKSETVVDTPGACIPITAKMYQDVFAGKEGWNVYSSETDIGSHVFIAGHGLIVDPTFGQFERGGSGLNIQKDSKNAENADLYHTGREKIEPERVAELAQMYSGWVADNVKRSLEDYVEELEIRVQNLE